VFVKEEAVGDAGALGGFPAETVVVNDGTAGRTAVLLVKALKKAAVQEWYGAK